MPPLRCKKVPFVNMPYCIRPNRQTLKVIIAALLMIALAACATATPATTGEVKGVLLDFSGQPAEGGAVSLLKVEGAEDTLQLSPAEGLPQASIGKAGTSLLRDVPPGKYALASYASAGGFMTLNGDQGNAVIFDVVAGQVVDLGNLAMTTAEGKPAIIMQPSSGCERTNLH